jgi:hypothetical protein
MASTQPEENVRNLLVALLENYSHARLIALCFSGRAGRPLAARNGRWGRGEVLSPSLSVRHPTIAVQENGTYGGQGKAVGCVPPTALLFEQAASIQDQQNQTLNQHDCGHARDGKH